MDEEDFDQENNPNSNRSGHKRKRSLADQATDYIQMMKNKNSFANNTTDNEAPNANEENKSL